MDRIVLGKTGIEVNKNGFGALPIQRVDKETAVRILRMAKDLGINYFDTARAYSDSEEKLGLAFENCRDEIIISTKSGSFTPEGLRADLSTSLSKLRTDHIDIYQLHNPPFCPKPGDGSGLYETLLGMKAEGKILHIGITNHRLTVAKEAIESGLYETLQFPFSYLASEKETELVRLTAEAGMGFIAMKALSGGLIQNAEAAYAFLAQFPCVEPIWGIQKEEELLQFIACQNEKPSLTPELLAAIEEDRRQLAGEFCRGCGYCMPCPAGIEINTCARMSLLLRRSPVAGWLTEKWQQEMAKIDSCLHCGACMQKCPYGLATPDLLRRNYDDYKTFL